jgi:antitoxin component YwqK of YwqJK toxin-antitoxin module
MSLKSLLSISLLTSVFVLGGCATTQNISNSQIPAEIKSKLTTNKAIIGYYGKEDNPEYCGCVSQIDSTYTMKPVKDGYYRVLLGRNAEGHFLVQDFYQATNKPQSSPAWVLDPLKLFSFDTNDIDGTVSLYSKDGKTVAKFVTKDGETIEGEHFYLNGQRGSVYKTDESGKTHVELWYASGKKAAEYTLDEYQDIVTAKAWTEDGNVTEELQEILDKVDALLEYEF